MHKLTNYFEDLLEKKGIKLAKTSYFIIDKDTVEFSYSFIEEGLSHLEEKKICKSKRAVEYLVEDIKVSIGFETDSISPDIFVDDNLLNRIKNMKVDEGIVIIKGDDRFGGF